MNKYAEFKQLKTPLIQLKTEFAKYLKEFFYGS